jgi:hypothetical protein
MPLVTPRARIFFPAAVTALADAAACGRALVPALELVPVPVHAFNPMAVSANSANAAADRCVAKKHLQFQ